MGLGFAMVCRCKLRDYVGVLLIREVILGDYC